MFKITTYQSVIGFTRSSLYEEHEEVYIAWKNEEIPPNLRQFFTFNGTVLLVTPPNGLSIDFVIARPLKLNDTFVSEWCAPSEEEYAKCDNDVLVFCNTFSKPIFHNPEICNRDLASVVLVRQNFKTYFTASKTGHFGHDIANPFMCHRIITDGRNSNYTDTKIENFIHGRWILEYVGGGSVGGLKYMPLPGYPKYHQSGRIKIGRDYEIVETLKSLQISLNESKIINTSYVSPSLPKQIPINYLLVIIFGGICGGFICLSLICLIGFLIVRQKRKETFNGRPSFSLESIDESAIQEYQSQIISSYKKNFSNVESIQNDCGYTKLIQTDFKCSSEKIISIQSFENQNIIQFLTQKFETSNPIKDPKSADKLLEEAFEEPLIENRAIKLLQIV
uniref:Uncharacterized protein n=1 Tax=Panagrolaimus davidi TaxID=227884 RepID=A0A914PEB5_9BILA